MLVNFIPVICITDCGIFYSPPQVCTKFFFCTSFWFTHKISSCNLHLIYNPFSGGEFYFYAGSILTILISVFYYIFTQKNSINKLYKFMPLSHYTYTFQLRFVRFFLFCLLKFPAGQIHQSPRVLALLQSFPLNSL